MKIKSVFLTLPVPPILGNNPKESPFYKNPFNQCSKIQQVNVSSRNCENSVLKLRSDIFFTILWPLECKSQSNSPKNVALIKKLCCGTYSHSDSFSCIASSKWNFQAQFQRDALALAVSLSKGV